MKIKSTKLSFVESIRHCFYSRLGGVSDGLYNSLNCSFGSKDKSSNVQKNQSVIAQDLEAKHLVVCNQVHKDEVVIVQKPWNNKDSSPSADAMVTNLPNIALGIVTADCVPVLFTDTKNNIIGAAHCGWGSAILGLAAKTVDCMVKLGADKETIIAALGPSIKQDSYEVDSKFRQNFISQDQHNAKFFIEKINGKFLFNLPAYIVKNLYQKGIKNIDVIDQDTYSQPDKFFSYRRSCHNNESDYGRQISAIMLKSNA